MKVDPAKGALVRDPLTKLAVEVGAEVDEHDPYWSRAIADGDVCPHHVRHHGGKPEGK